MVRPVPESTVDLALPAGVEGNPLEVLRAAVDPVESGIHVLRVVRTAPSRLRVHAGSPGSAAALRDSPAVRAAGFVPSAPSLRLPRVLIRGVPKVPDYATLIPALRSQNFPEVPLEEFRRTIKVVSTSARDGSEYASVTCEVTSELFRQLIERGQVYLWWSTCPVDPSALPLRCHRCQGLGHMARVCRAPGASCGHCAATGHRIDACPSRSSPPRCVVCLRAGMVDDHDVRGARCPFFRAAQRDLLAFVDLPHA